MSNIEVRVMSDLSVRSHARDIGVVEGRGLCRRLVDAAVAVAALLVLAPLMAAVGVAIVIESGGPVIFSQTRLGRGGRRFQLHKFRKFAPGAGQNGPGVTLHGDPRMTRVGRFIERAKLDELPQLWNIAVGEMSLVGPRPESLSFTKCFEPCFWAVLDHKPGIFGPCQALFRNEGRLYREGCDPDGFYCHTIFPLKAQIDLQYYRRRTLSSDVFWIAHGMLAVIGASSLALTALPDEGPQARSHLLQ